MFILCKCVLSIFINIFLIVYYIIVVFMRGVVIGKRFIKIDFFYYICRIDKGINN